MIVTGGIGWDRGRLNIRLKTKVGYGPNKGMGPVVINETAQIGNYCNLSQFLCTWRERCGFLGIREI